VLAKLARYDEALKAYEKEIELKPEDADAWFHKACAYSLKGDKENALKHLSKVIDLDAKYKEKAKSDDDFKNLWNDEDFKRVVS
jgi:tetratricopeptide (TPR) repeat protein